ncbi:MAG: hypothetical protein ACKVS8_08435 [Phycisphaerales bacterium]
MSPSTHTLPRVLHLADAAGPAGGEGTLWACACAASLPALAHETWGIGRREAQHAAHALGLKVALWACPSLGRSQLAWPPFRRARAEHAKPACVVAWSRPAADLARLLFRERVPIVAARISVPGAPGLHAAGIRHTPVPPPLLPLPLGPASARQDARNQLGLRDNDAAILLLADTNAHADAAVFTRWLSMAATAGHRAVGLVRDGTPGLARAARFLATTGAGAEVIRVRGPLIDAVQVADAVVWPRPDAAWPDTNLVWASAIAASGIPVLAAPGAASLWLLGECPGVQIARGSADHQMADLLACFADHPARVHAAAAANAARLRSGPDAWRFHEELMDAITRVSAACVSA